MSELFRFPHILVNHDNFTVNNCANASAAERSPSKRRYPVDNINRRAPLRDDHIILWLIDHLLKSFAALIAFFALAVTLTGTAHATQRVNAISAQPK